LEGLFQAGATKSGAKEGNDTGRGGNHPQKKNNLFINPETPVNIKEVEKGKTNRGERKRK